MLSFNDIPDISESDSVSLEYAEDGTVMHLYFDGNSWKTSTLNKKDATQSYYFSKKNFDSLFWEAFYLSCDLESLDKNEVYKFILLHPENRLVIKYSKPELVIISPKNNTLPFECTKSIKSFFLSKDYFESLSTPEKRGVIVNLNDTLYKYDFNWYSIISNVRGNTRNIETRYLELLNNQYHLYILKQEYEECSYKFKFLEKRLYNLYEYIYHLYIQTCIEKTKSPYVLNPMIGSLLRKIYFYSKNTFFSIDVVKFCIRSLKPSTIKKFFLLAEGKPLNYE
jgi:hypothetical protein